MIRNRRRPCRDGKAQEYGLLDRRGASSDQPTKNPWQALLRLLSCVLRSTISHVLFSLGECAVLILVIHVASQAYLTQILCGSPKTVSPADLASSKLVVSIICCSHCWFCHQRFAHSSPPVSSNEYQSPETKSASYSLFRRLVDGRFLVLSVLEARGLAFVRVVEDMAEARIRSPVSAVSPSFVLQLLLRRHGSVHFANTFHLPIPIEYVAICVINPSGIAASIVL